MFVDVHTHLDFPDFTKDLDQVIERAKKAGVKAIIANGVNPSSNRKTLEIAKKYDIVKPALGAYPLDIIGYSGSGSKKQGFDLDEEINFIIENKKKVVALGEVGLDNYHAPGTLDQQKPFFQKIIGLSEDLKLPLIVHSRKAELETIEMLESSKARVIMHCFGGSKRLVRRIIDNKWNFSIPTNVVRSQHFQMIVDLAPLKHILTETDAPFLSPCPNKRNESSFIPEAVRKIAEIRNLTFEDASHVIFQNYQRIF